MGSENTEQLVVVPWLVIDFEISVVLNLSSGLNFEACFCQVCYVSSLFLSLRTKSNARPQFQLDFHRQRNSLRCSAVPASSTASYRARFLGGFLVAQIVATFHGRAGAAISIRGLCCLGWDLEPMRLCPMCSGSTEAREKSSDEGSEVTGPKRNKTGAYVV